MEELHETPEEGEFVLATARDLTQHGVYVTLDEYGNQPAFLHRSEISTGWVRHIDRYVQPNQKLVLKVIRVSPVRREIDLSLRQVTGDERKTKLLEIKKAEKARSVLDLLRSRAALAPTDLQQLSSTLTDAYDTLYDALEDIARRGRKALEKFTLPEPVLQALEDAVREKIVIPTVEVRGVLQLRSHAPDGVDLLRRALREGLNVHTGGATVRITYLGAPRYRISVTAETYKTAEKALDAALQKIQSTVVKHRGEHSFTREESRKSRGE